MLIDTKTVLVFSGGQTRDGAGPRTEAFSYYEIAESASWYNVTKSRPDLLRRVTTEEFARDSLENLLFSICRFREYTGHYPKWISVIGFEFKRRRFEEIHRRALKWSIIRFNYKGFDSPFQSPPNEGEKKNAMMPYQHDVYGCHGKLAEKRKSRNPFNRIDGYVNSCPEIRDLLLYCPSDGVSLFAGPLPWA
ncbi:hypothetical protein SeLEV6574_g02828 [Synchytrium endobioticum]|nr:hypothetical protein SeLEV6574_g02828 [Synchytrium endobioticum]